MKKGSLPTLREGAFDIYVYLMKREAMPLTAAMRGSERKLAAELTFLCLKLISAISHTASSEESNAGAA